MLYAGIDWGDSGSVMVVMNDKGKVLKKWKVEQKLEDYEMAVTEISRLEGNPDEVAFAIETPHHPLLHFLVENGYTGYTPNPKSVDRAREIESPSGKKDDYFDALTLANMVRMDRGRLRSFLPDSPATVKLRALCDIHRSLVEMRTALTNRMKHCLKYYWPIAPKLFSKLDSKIAIAFFTRWSDPKTAMDEEQSVISDFMKEHSYPCPKNIGKILAKLRRPSIPLSEAAIEGKTWQLKFLLPQLETLCRQIESCEKEIAIRFDAHPDSAIFQSLLINKNSTSRILVARLLCDFGDRRDRYTSRDEILAIAGVAPVTYETGNGSFRLVKMRRACRKHFRNDIQQLADLYRQHYPWATAIYQVNLSGKKNRHNTALRALGNILLRIVFYLWKTEEQFDAEIYLARRAEQILVQNTHRARKTK